MFPSVTRKMVTARRDIFATGCRIIRWKMTTAQIDALLDELYGKHKSIDREHRRQEILAGQAMCYGIPIKHVEG